MIEEIIELNDYQNEALKTDIYPNDKFNIGYKALGLCGEAGEVADKIKKYLEIITDNLMKIKLTRLLKNWVILFGIFLH